MIQLAVTNLGKKGLNYAVNVWPLARGISLGVYKNRLLHRITRVLEENVGKYMG